MLVYYDVCTLLLGCFNVVVHWEPIEETSFNVFVCSAIRVYLCARACVVCVCVCHMCACMHMSQHR